MNLYLVLAIALGAISGVVEAPVLRPVQLVAARASRGEQRQARVASAVRVRRPVPLWASSSLRIASAPRRYAIGSPRAPAAA